MFYDLNLPRWQAPLLFNQVSQGKSHSIAIASYMIDSNSPVEDWPTLKVYFNGTPSFLGEHMLKLERSAFEEHRSILTYELAGFSRPPKGNEQDPISVTYLWANEKDSEDSSAPRPAQIMITGLINGIKNIKGIYLVELLVFTRLASENSQHKYYRQRLSFTATPEVISGIQHVERAASLKAMTLAEFQEHSPYRFLIDKPTFWSNDKGYLESRGKIVNVFALPTSPFYEYFHMTKSWYELYDGNPLKVTYEGAFYEKKEKGYMQSMIHAETARS